MNIKQLIEKENLKRKINNPRIIFINYKYQGPDCKVFNMYYVNLLPINEQDFIKDIKRYGSILIEDEFELKNLTLNSELDEDIFESFINSEWYQGLFSGTADPNRNKRYQICNKDSIIFSFECSEVQKENFEELVKAYTHIPDLKNSMNTNPKDVYTFTNDNERDIYGNALLEGCSEAEAYALSIGIEVNPLKIPYVGGYYELKDDYRNYYESCFGLRGD